METKKKPGVVILSILILFLCACGEVREGRQEEKSEESWEEWGSFTAEDCYSYDGRYLAKQTVEINESVDIKYVKVDIFDTKSNELVDSFYAERAWDFWGICWESDSYNIWIQSGDTGTSCFVYQDGKWIRDFSNSVERPADIISKYDDILAEEE